MCDVAIINYQLCLHKESFVQKHVKKIFVFKALFQEYIYFLIFCIFIFFLKKSWEMSGGLLF